MIAMREMVQMAGYPVLVRVDRVTWGSMKLAEHEVKETKDISLQFHAAHWFVAGDHEYKDKDAFIIFVSQNAFDELSRARKFNPSYRTGKGWSCANDLSSDTRNELLSTAMSKVDK